jgi:hypothetical protein
MLFLRIVSEQRDLLDHIQTPSVVNHRSGNPRTLLRCRSRFDIIDIHVQPIQSMTVVTPIISHGEIIRQDFCVRRSCAHLHHASPHELDKFIFRNDLLLALRDLRRWTSFDGHHRLMTILPFEQEVAMTLSEQLI